MKTALLLALGCMLMIVPCAYAGGHGGHGGGHHSGYGYGGHGDYHGGHHSYTSVGIGIGLGGWGYYPSYSGYWGGYCGPYYAPPVVYAPAVVYQPAPVYCPAPPPVVVERTVVVNNYYGNDHWRPRYSVPAR